MPDARWIPPTLRPQVMGRKWMVSSGHDLATAAGADVLRAGGNATDAGVAAGVCINVVQSDLTNLGGVAPIMVYERATGQVNTISGLGWWPRAANRELFEERFEGRIPPGIYRYVMPAALDAWLTALELYGTLPLERILAPALELARDGFPMHWLMRETLSEPATLRNIAAWPGTRELFLDGDGQVLPVGGVVTLPALANTLERLMDAARGAQTREEGIGAARALFYQGEIAEQLAGFCERNGAWVTRDDLAGFRVEVEPAAHVSYRGYDVYACGPWCQGAVVLETLNILEGYPLGDMRPGSAAHYHLILEALKAAFADRDRYYGDPRFVRVPLDGLLSKEYAEAWRSRIATDRAADAMPQPGDAWRYSADDEGAPSPWRYPTSSGGVLEPDTSYLCVVDGDGNAFSATPSDGAAGAPLVPEVGIMISSRGMQSWMDPGHPCCLAPGKRPRLTPSPGLVLRDGALVMPYGTPGLDMQPQAMTQFLVNMIDFGMDVQPAIEAPRCASYSFPASSDPHAYFPGVAVAEGRVAAEVREELIALGHRLSAWPDWTGTAGSVCAISLDTEAQVLKGGADPRRVACALGW